MLGRLVLFPACGMLLNGCDLIRVLLPRHATTTAEVSEAMRRCGMPTSDVAWRVAPDGTFVIGKSTGGASSTAPQVECLMRWVDQKRIKIAYIGNEYYQR